MKNTIINPVQFISVLSFSLLLSSVAAQENATNPIDVAAIILIQSTFPALGLNSTPADPCLPTPYSCNSDDNTRITALNCGNKDLSGILVDFSLMDVALEIIDFSSNHLTQEFPDFLSKFPKLRELLTGNKICFSDDDVCPLSLKEKLKTATFVILMAACIIILL